MLITGVKPLSWHGSTLIDLIELPQLSSQDVTLHAKIVLSPSHEGFSFNT